MYIKNYVETFMKLYTEFLCIDLIMHVHMYMHYCTSPTEKHNILLSISTQSRVFVFIDEGTGLGQRRHIISIFCFLV